MEENESHKYTLLLELGEGRKSYVEHWVPHLHVQRIMVPVWVDTEMHTCTSRCIRDTEEL